MIIYLKGNDYHFETENVSRLFLPQEKITPVVVDAFPTSVPEGIVAFCTTEAEMVSCRLTLDSFDETLKETAVSYADQELVLCTLLYRLLAKLLGFTHDWGLITGVRPVKLLRRLIGEMGETDAAAYFRERLLVSDHKYALCHQTLKAENEVLALSRPDSFSLYVSIPFCPTRCDYCSFVSQTVVQAGKLIPAYVDSLCRELAYTGQLVKELGLRLETVYFGGGTPTTLSAEEMERVLRAVEDHFDLSTVREYTVEAGRPDTVTPEKMAVLHAAGVGRVSINPQTLQQPVLNAIGRKHTVEQFYDAFSLARQYGFSNVNTDLIAGLPGDSFDGFCDTLERICALDPESVTVHNLSMKRASNMVIQHREDFEAQDEAVNMVRYSAGRLPAAGYQPYYLYRQSRMVGNQENVGWAKPGYEGLYNVYIMDETHTILACGAGAVSKLKQPGTEYLERIFNYKFPYEYNAGLDGMLRRKTAVMDFYAKYCKTARDGL